MPIDRDQLRQDLLALGVKLQGSVRDNLRTAGRLLAEAQEAYHLKVQEAEENAPAELGGPMLRRQWIAAYVAREAAAKEVAETRYSVAKHDKEALETAATVGMSLLRDLRQEDADSGYHQRAGGAA